MKLLRIWFVYADNQTYGPYTAEELMSMLIDGTLKYSDYAFREGFANWEFIRNIPDFDRRLLNPGGNQPKINTPKKEETPLEAVNNLSEEMKDSWFLHDGKKQEGPHTTEYIKEGLNNKTIFWTYYVWKKGMENWTEIRQCKEFDRRKTPREEKITSTINTDLSTLEKNAIKHEDSLLSFANEKEQKVLIEEDNTNRYQNEIEGKIDIIDKDDIKGAFPLRSILSILGIVLLLFTTISLYPKFMEFLKEREAKKLYFKAIEFIEIKNYEEGFETLFNVIDLYPETNTKRKVQNYLRSKEPLIKASLQDELKRVRTLITLFYNKYNILPANAIDISYVPDFWLRYFGQIYYKADDKKNILINVYGIKRPVEGYLFNINPDNTSLESEIKISDFQAKIQSYIKLEYTGEKTPVTLQIPEPVKPSPSPARPIAPVQTKAPTIKEEFSEQAVGIKEEDFIEDTYKETIEEPEEEEEEEIEEAEETEKVVPSTKPDIDEYGDLIETIKKDAN